MARYNSELATRAVGNKFDLILIASRRVRELRNGYRALMPTDPKENATVTALREIEAGLVGRNYLLKPTEVNPVKGRRR